MTEKKAKYNAKTELKKIPLYEEKIRFIKSERERLLDDATKITPTLTDDVVSGSKRHDRLERIAVERSDLEAELDEREKALSEKREWLMKLVLMLEEPNHVRVLKKRYFEGKTLEQASVEMNYSYRNIRYIHGKALQAMTALMNETEV